MNEQLSEDNAAGPFSSSFVSVAHVRGHFNDKSTRRGKIRCSKEWKGRKGWLGGQRC